MSDEFYEAIGTLAARNTKEGFVALKTPRAMYDLFDGKALFDMLVENGVDPTNCWTARGKDGKSYLAYPGLNMVEDKPCLLFNFKSNERETNLITIEHPEQTFFRLVDTKPFDQYMVNIGGLDLPIALNQAKDTKVPPVGSISSLTIRVVEGGGGGSNFCKLIDLVKQEGHDLTIDLTVTELMSRKSEKFGRSYSIRVEEYDTILNIPGMMGQNLELDQINDEDLALPQTLKITMVLLTNGHYSAKYEYLGDIPF